MCMSWGAEGSTLYHSLLLARYGAFGFLQVLLLLCRVMKLGRISLCLTGVAAGRRPSRKTQALAEWISTGPSQRVAEWRRGEQIKFSQEAAARSAGQPTSRSGKWWMNGFTKVALWTVLCGYRRRARWICILWLSRRRPRSGGGLLM